MIFIDTRIHSNEGSRWWYISREKSTTTMANYAVIERDLFTPPLEAVKNALSKGLSQNFAEVSVEVVDCPDLSLPPFNLAAKGLGGRTGLVEVGGPPYLLPSVDRTKVYQIQDLVQRVGLQPCLVIGAGAAPWPYLGKNAEMMANVYFSQGEVSVQRTHVCKVIDETRMELSVLPSTETRFALLANLFFSEGKPSKVLKVHCKTRTGKDNFMSSMRLALENEFKDKLIGLGGAFLINEGKARQHVMPDFSQTPIHSEEELNKWLHFYNMSAPLVAVGTLVSRDVAELDLRVQHFHSFSQHGEGGHYHEDTTPSSVEYLGYFNLGDKIYRFDKPPVSHSFGKD